MRRRTRRIERKLTGKEKNKKKITKEDYIVNYNISYSNYLNHARQERRPKEPYALLLPRLYRLCCHCQRCYCLRWCCRCRCASPKGLDIVPSQWHEPIPTEKAQEVRRIALLYVDGGCKAKGEEDGEQCMQVDHLEDCGAANGDEEEHEIFGVVVLKIGKHPSEAEGDRQEQACHANGL